MSDDYEDEQVFVRCGCMSPERPRIRCELGEGHDGDHRCEILNGNASHTWPAHDPSSQDVDSAWLTPEERIEDEWGGKALDHALLADELINELYERLATRTHVAAPMECDCNPCVTDRNLLRRVDAIRKQTP